MPELQNEQNQRQWTDEKIARAKITEPPSPTAYTSPAGPYILDLPYSRKSF